MGQYYKTIIRNGNKTTVYNRNLIIDGNEEYTLAKLMEHSWWGNRYMSTICKRIYDNARPSRVIWMGDYADNYLECSDLETANGLTQKQVLALYGKTWGDNVDGITTRFSNFLLEGKFLVNHTKRIYLDCDAYYERSKVKKYGETWCIHPLSILTCVGNGMGMGDYSCPTEDSTFDKVGTWAWDEISIDDVAPEGYAETIITFKEREYVA